MSRLRVRSIRRSSAASTGIPVCTRIGCSRSPGPVAQAVAGAYLDWLADATYPIRHGVHSNTAFALAFARDYAGSCAATALGELVGAKAREWYLGDIDAPARWEPSGAD